MKHTTIHRQNLFVRFLNVSVELYFHNLWIHETLSTCDPYRRVSRSNSKNSSFFQSGTDWCEVVLLHWEQPWVERETNLLHVSSHTKVQTRCGGETGGIIRLETWAKNYSWPPGFTVVLSNQLLVLSQIMDHLWLHLSLFPFILYWFHLQWISCTVLIKRITVFVYRCQSP